MREDDVDANHREFLREIKRQAAEANVRLANQGDRYIGTSKPFYPLKAAQFGQIARDWIGRHPDLTPAEFVSLLDSLSHGETSTEAIFVGVLLGHLPKLRKTLDPRHLDFWLERAEGWAEVDCICQSSFTADEVLSNWKAWKSLLIAFSKSHNVHKRRASLVLLTKPLRESDDPQLARLAFANIGKLKHEKRILITKAISWLLRALIKYHRAEVEAYLQANADTLPAIAVRETSVKLRTGKKTYH